jgi:hypothetical protein
MIQKQHGKNKNSATYKKSKIRKVRSVCVSRFESKVLNQITYFFESLHIFFESLHINF